MNNKIADLHFVVEIVCEKVTKREIIHIARNGLTKVLKLTSDLKIILRGVKEISSIEVTVDDQKEPLQVQLMCPADFGAHFHEYHEYE